MITRITGTAIQAKASNIYQKAIADYGISILLLVLTFVCLFTPSILLFKQIAANTLYIMMLMLVSGFMFFLLKHERLMIVSFLCCGILCLHLKSSANKQMRLAAVTENPSLNVSFINLANAESDYNSVIDYLLHLDSDFISVQELTPDWNAELRKGLEGQYKFMHTMTRLDQYGMGFFSKKPILSIDTIYFDQVPNLISSIELEDNHKCHIVSCQVVPPVNQAAFMLIEQHFASLSEHLDTVDDSYLVIGDLHLPPWASELQKFKVTSHLEDSRRDINPRNIDGSMSLPRIPVEHIFFCEKLECTSFSELGNDTIGRVGITGTYQLHNDQTEVVN